MTRTSALPVAITFVLLGLAGPATAESQVAKSVRVTESGLDERIDVALKDAAPADFFRSLAEILGLELAAVPALGSNLTMEVHEVRVATVLTVACESLGCLWSIEGQRLTIAESPQVRRGRGTAPGKAEGAFAARLEDRIGLELTDADLRQVLEAFASILDVDVEVDESLHGAVTIRLQDTSVRTALDALCRVHGCRWELVETPDRPVLRFSPR